MRSLPARAISRPLYPATPGRRRTTCRGLLLALAVVGFGWPALAQEAPEIAEGKVEAKLDRSTDAQIERRLRSTFDTLDELATVDVAVEAGVVRLSGKVDSADAHELAAALAQQVEGIVAVENEIEENRSVRHRLDVALQRLRERTWALVDNVPLLLVALATLVGTIVVSRLVTSWDAPFDWLTQNVFLRDLARQAVRVLFALGGAIIALEIMDATALIGAALGAAGVAGLAIGFAFRDLVENYLASILLSLRRPFAPRDLVRIEGHLGHVARLTSRATILVTPDGNHVRVPNGIVFKATIENFTRNPERRFSFGVAVGVDENLVDAQELATRILSDMGGVLDDPSPFCKLEELGDSSVMLKVFGWVNQREADYAKVRSEAIRLVKQAFDRQEIEMPEPITRVRVETVTHQEASPERTMASQDDRVRDVSPESHVEGMVDFERAGSDEDLLAEAGKSE